MSFFNRYSLWRGAGMVALVGGFIRVVWRPVAGAIVAGGGTLASLLYWRILRTSGSTLDNTASLS